MWITGNDAVNRYDGSMIKVYNLNKYFKDCPNLQQGYGFAEDNESNIYIGSVKGLYVYHRNTDKFTLQKIFADTVNEEAMPFAFKDGKVWCFNKNYEIAAYNVNDSKVSEVAKLPVNPLPSIHIYDLEDNQFYYRWPFFDGQGNIWFITLNEVFRLNSNSKKVSKINLGVSLPVKPVFYCSSYDATNNEILLGTKTGLVTYNTNSTQERYLNKLGGVPIDEIQAICNNKAMIALVYKSELLITDKKLEQRLWVNIAEQKKFVRYLASDFDRTGRLWVCDNGRGQVVYNFSSQLLSKLPGEDIAFTGLKGIGVSSFAEFENGDVAVQYKYVINRRVGKLELINFPKDFNFATTYRAITDNTRKGIWLATTTYKEHQLKIYFTGRNKIPVLEYAINESDSVGNLQDLIILDNGRTLASFSAGVCWLKNHALAKIKNQPYKNPFTINKISKNRCAISYLNKDMWLAEFTETDEIKFLHKILPGVQSFYLQEDTVRHQYWAGTNNGVYLLDKNFNPLKLFDANNGLAGTYIYGILLDDEGNAWCSHQRGLSSINAKTFQIINYDKSDGIQDWDFNNRAFYKASDGTLYFGGVNGFNYFKPPVKSIIDHNSEVYIDEIWVNNKTYWPDTNANLIQKLNLSFTENNISIKAIIKDLANANSRQLIYRIKETDIKWNYLSNNSTISFNSLSPGTYTLQLGTYDKYTNKEIIQKTLLISISAPFYRKAWFWVLISILVTALLFGIYNRRKINNQQTAFRQQLALEQQRQKMTADLHDDIGSSLSSLQVNSAVANQLLDKDSKQAKQVLDKIETQSKDLADKIGDIIWSMKPGKDEFMTISSRIKNFANDMLSSTDISYQVQTDAAADTEIKDITARKNIVFITKEAINNAVKYSKATHILITLKKANNQFILLIKDNGVGFTTAKQTGNGIENMRKRAVEMKGNFVLDSTPGQGTVISVTVPVP